MKSLSPSLCFKCISRLFYKPVNALSLWHIWGTSTSSSLVPRVQGVQPLSVQTNFHTCTHQFAHKCGLGTNNTQNRYKYIIVYGLALDLGHISGDLGKLCVFLRSQKSKNKSKMHSLWNALTWETNLTVSLQASCLEPNILHKHLTFSLIKKEVVQWWIKKTEGEVNGRCSLFGPWQCVVLFGT